MKTKTIFFFLLIAITTLFSSVLVVSGEGTDVVYDADGDSVKTNVPYFVSFMTIEYGMWICRMRLGSADPESCPGQQPIMFTDPNIAPTPVMFVLSSSTSSSDQVVVNESADLSIKFATPGHCGNESAFWRVVKNMSDSDGEVFLNGTKLSIDSTFTIHKTNEYYMFSFAHGTDQQTTISLSNDQPGGIARLLSKKLSGEMEIYFYKAKLK